MNKIERKLYKVNATGRPAGRVASEVAIMLRGKNKPEYTPNLDCGDIVELTGLDEIKFTGNKMEQKIYYRYSGYQGGLKEEALSKRLDKDKVKLFKEIVEEMLPPVKFRGAMLKRLIIR